MVSSAPLLPYSLELDAPTPPHKQPDSSVQTDMSVVSSDDASEPPPSPLFTASHTLACDLLFVPATHHTFLCPLC